MFRDCSAKWKWFCFEDCCLDINHIKYKNIKVLESFVRRDSLTSLVSVYYSILEHLRKWMQLVHLQK